MGDLGAHNAEISINNFPTNLSTLSSLPRTPSPLSRIHPAGWYLCENKGFSIPQESIALLALLASRDDIADGIEDLPSTPSITHGQYEQQTPTAPERAVNHPNGSAHLQHTAKLKQALDTAIDQHIDASAKRLAVRELRQGLKYKREEEGAVRATLMKKLNALSTQNGSSAPLLAEFEQLQSVTNAYLDLERNYNRAEDELGAQEYALLKTMNKLSDLLRQTPTPAVFEASEPATEPGDYGSDDTLTTVSGVQPVPPSVAAYLSRVGDMHILEERLAELHSEWRDIADKQALRERVGLPISDEFLGFLRGYDEEQRQIKKELNEVRVDLNRLRNICNNEGVVMDEYAKDIDVFHDCYDFRPDEFAHQPEDPLKISDTEHLYSFSEPGSGKLDRTTFINKWILQQLRQSTVEIKRFKSRPELQDLGRLGWDDANISRLALTMWFTDDMSAPSLPATVSGGGHIEKNEDGADLSNEAAQEPDSESLWDRRLPTIRRWNSDRYLRSDPPRVRSLSV